MTPSLSPSVSHGEAGVWGSIQQLADAIPHPIATGAIVVAVGALAFALAGPLKSRLDRARRSKSKPLKSRAPWLRFGYYGSLAVGFIFTAAGTGLTINGGRLEAETRETRAREESKAARDEMNRQFQNLLSAFNAVKQEHITALTEERLKAIGKDVTRWAEDFASRLPDKERQLQEAKSAERQREIQLSSESAPLFNFVLGFIERVARAYAQQTGAQLEIHLPPLPENYFDREPSVHRYIKFGANSQWRFLLAASAPVDEQNPPYLSISMSEPRGNGIVRVRRAPDGKQFSFSGGGPLPVVDAAPFFRAYDMTDFEQTVDTLFRPFLEGELIQSRLDTPTPTPTAHSE